MWIERYNRANFSFSTFATDVKKLIPLDAERNNFDSALVAVKPGKITIIHMHHDAEIFLIVRGHGEVISHEQQESINEGNIIYLRPYTEHAICNYSQDEDLIYLTIWWENPKLYTAMAIQSDKKERKITYIYSASPTPNGDLHVGHLSGPYLASDIYKRFHQDLRKENIYHLCGVDESQSYPQLLADKRGVPLNEVLDQFTDQIQTSLRLARIEMDGFVRPRNSQKCKKLTQSLFNQLVDTNLLFERSCEAWFCENCKHYLHESYLRGICPHCKENASGGGCEACNLYYEEGAILSPSCAYCEKNPKKRLIHRWHFLLETYREDLLRLHNQPHTNPLARSYVARVFKHTLPNIPINHLGNWGEKIQAPNGKEIAIYSYFELLSRYLAAKPEGKTNSKTQIIQFLGIDNSFWRLVFLPALLIAAGQKDLLRYSIVNEFYEMEHKKFSTSRHHAIWVKDLMLTYAVDVARLYICYTRPENGRTNFSLIELDNFICTELVAKWQDLIDLLNTKLDTFNRIAPKPGLWSSRQHHYFEWLQQHKNYLEKYYQAEAFSPQSVALQLCRLVEEVRQFIKLEQPLDEEGTQSAYYKTTIALGLLSLKLLAILAYPIMPGFGQCILSQLREKGIPYLDSEQVFTWVQSQHAIEKLTFDFKDNMYV